MSGFIHDLRQQEALHAELQILLAGYLDQELEEDERRQVEAHLIGCVYCREDLIRQTLLQQRLEQERQAVHLPMALQIQLDAMFESGEIHQPRVNMPDNSKKGDWRTGFVAFSRHWSGLSGWLAASVLLVILLSPHFLPASEVPMIRDALTQYQRMQSIPLPLAAPGSIDPADSPVSWPGSRLLASWSTQVGGEQAKAYWLRSGETTLLVLNISEAVFFRHPEVREALEHQGIFHFRGVLSVLAIPAATSGILIVGPENALPDKGDIRTF